MGSDKAMPRKFESLAKGQSRRKKERGARFCKLMGGFPLLFEFLICDIPTLGQGRGITNQIIANTLAEPNITTTRWQQVKGALERQGDDSKLSEGFSEPGQTAASSPTQSSPQGEPYV